MIRENPQVASFFEYFNGLDASLRFSRLPFDGARFTQMICDVHPITTMVMARGYPIEEVAYPFERPGVRFGREQGVPYILGAMLPSLPIDDPDAFYDEVCEFTRALPESTAAVHHLALFDWISERLGRTEWVERSGGSIVHLGELNKTFRDARFVHIHRAGEEAALSMREHHVFRLGVMLSYGLKPEAGGESEGQGDDVTRLIDSRPDAEYFGRFWNDQLMRGMRALADLDADQYCEIRFEDLVERPRVEFSRVAEFFELPDVQGPWFERAVALVRKPPAARANELPEGERLRLDRACRSGNLLLGRA